jgi:hypothetical protein
MSLPWTTNLLHFNLNKLFKTYFVIWHLAWQLFGYFSKNWVIFSKSSGHPGQEPTLLMKDTSLEYTPPLIANN